jgi:hypothetical protein
MRTAFTSALLCLIGAMVFAQPNPKLDEKAAKRLIEEYIDFNTGDTRRAVIITELKGASPMLGQKALKSLMADDIKRERALEIALAIRVPGLFDSAKKYIDGPDEQAIVSLGCIVPDKSAAEFLFDRWKALDVEGASFVCVDTAFKAHALPIECVSKFKAILADKDGLEARKSSAVAIVNIQFGINEDSPEALLRVWDSAEKSFRADAVSFRLTGADLLAEYQWDAADGAAKVGGNYRLPKGSSLKLASLPDSWNVGSFTIQIRVRVDQGAGLLASVQCETGWWYVKFIDGEWLLETGEKVKYTAPGKLGEWAVLKFVIKDNGAKNVRGERTCAIYVNDKWLTGWAGAFKGDFKGIRIDAGEARAVAGGAE